MDQSLKRVVARGVRPHMPYRSIDSIRDSLAGKKIKQLLILENSLRADKRRMKLFSCKNFGSDFYYQTKANIKDLKNQIEETKQQSWFIRYVKQYVASKEATYSLRQHNTPYWWVE